MCSIYWQTVLHYFWCLKNHNLIDTPYEFIYRITARHICFSLSHLRTVVICSFIIYVARCMSSSWQLHYHLISVSFIFRDTILTICGSETWCSELAGCNQNRGESILRSPNPSGHQQQAPFRRLVVCLRQRRPPLPFPAGGRDKLRHRRGAGGSGFSAPAGPQDGSTSREQQRQHRRQDVLRRPDPRARLGLCSLSSVSSG